MAARITIVEETLLGLVTAFEAFLNVGVARIEAAVDERFDATDALLMEIKNERQTSAIARPVRHLYPVSDGA